MDPTFDGDGIVTTDVGLADYGSEQVTALTLQPDGKIIAVGNAATETYQGGFKRGDIAVVRYDTNGTLDNTFSGDGKTATSFGKNTPSVPTDVAVQFDGKIVVSAIATGDFEMVRYNSNGSLDTAFGGKGTGRVTTAIGKNSNDNTFAMELQADHKIVVAGVTQAQNSSRYDLALVRYNVDGSLDTSFSGDGKVTANFGYSLSNPDMGLEMAIYANTSPYAGRIVVVSALLSPFTSSDNGVIVARYLPNGNFDPDFGVGGAGYVNLTSFGGNPGYDNGAGVAIQANDGIVVGRTGTPRIGGGADMYLARFQPNGILDPAFGAAGTGIAQTLLRDDNGSPDAGSPISKSVAIQADGKIVLGVNVYFTNHTKDKMVVARYNTNGSLDDGTANDSMPSDSFGVRGIATGIATSTGTTVTHVEGMAIQADGKIVIGGQAGGGTTGRPADFALARFLGDDPPASPSAATADSSSSAGSSNDFALLAVSEELVGTLGTTHKKR